MNLQRLFNNVVGLTGLLALALSASLAFAEVKEVMKIKIKTESGVSETVKIENLAVGDTEVLVTESGKEVLVSRLEDSLQLELDGELINVKMPQVHAMHEGGDGERHVRIMRKHGAHHDLDSEDIFVTDDDEVIVADGMTKHVIVRREVAGEGAAEGEVTCDIEIEVDGASDEDMEAEFADLCGEGAGDGEDVVVIKKRVMIERDSSDNN